MKSIDSDLFVVGVLVLTSFVVGAGGRDWYLKRQETLKTKAAFNEAIAKGKRENEFNEFLANMQVLPKIHALEARLKVLETPATPTNTWQGIDWGDLVITNLLGSTNIHWLITTNTNIYLNTR